MAVANPDERMFTGGESDPSASPVAAMIIKQLMDRGVQPTAGNMRRAVEANARGGGQAGPDVLSGIRNDVAQPNPVATPSAPQFNAGSAPLGGNPYGDEGPMANPTAPPGAGGGMGPGGIGAMIAGAVPLLYMLYRQATSGGGGAPTAPAPAMPPVAPGAGGIPTMNVTPTAPVQGAQPNISGTSNTNVAPNAATPQPKPAAAPTTSAGGSVTIRPGASAAPAPSINLPSGGSPAVSAPPPAAAPAMNTSSSLQGLLNILKQNKLGMGKLGAGLPFVGMPGLNQTKEDMLANTRKQFGIGRIEGR